MICVDDEVMLLDSLKQELKQDEFFQDLEIETVDSGEKALAMINEIEEEGDEVPIVISDQRMPGMTGDALFLELQKDRPHINKILLTGYSDLDAVVRLVNHNALYRYIEKPWDSHDLKLTIREAVISYRHRKLIQQQNLKIEKITQAMVSCLENANFYYDEDTGNHIQRMAVLSEYIAELAGCDKYFCEQIRLYAPLHDVGKVGIDKSILTKSGKLTKEEYQLIKEHVSIGARILGDSAIDPMAKNIVLYHHEKWNGTGYKFGLSGEDIPLEARIVSLADVFDALISRRVYKAAYRIEDALEAVKSEKGVSFDPRLAELFLNEIRSREDLKKKVFEKSDHFKVFLEEL